MGLSSILGYRCPGFEEAGQKQEGFRAPIQTNNYHKSNPNPYYPTQIFKIRLIASLMVILCFKLTETRSGIQEPETPCLHFVSESCVVNNLLVFLVDLPGIAMY